MGPSARRGRGVIGNVKAIGDINHTTLWGVCITQPHPTTSSCDGVLREDNGKKKGDICTAPKWVPIWGPGSPWGPFSVFGSPKGPHFLSRSPFSLFQAEERVKSQEHPLLSLPSAY